MKTIKELILEIMGEWKRDYYEDIWNGYSQLFDQMDGRLSSELITPGGIRSAMKDLREEGKVVYTSYYNDDGKLQGRGYFLTKN